MQNLPLPDAKILPVDLYQFALKEMLSALSPPDEAPDKASKETLI